MVVRQAPHTRTPWSPWRWLAGISVVVSSSTVERDRQLGDGWALAFEKTSLVRVTSSSV